MALQRFDELNNMSTIWYDKMEITEEAKKRRVDLSLLFCEIIIMFFDMVMAENRSHEQLVGWLTERLNVVASKELKADNIAYINDWSRKEAEHIVDVTERHYEEIKSNDWADVIIKTDENGNTYTYKPKEVSFEEFGISIPEKDYWTSDIRGILLGIVYQNPNSSILYIGDNEYDTEDELEPNLSKSIITEPSTCPNELLFTNEISRLNDEVFELKKEVISKDMIVHELKLEIGKLRKTVSLSCLL